MDTKLGRKGYSIPKKGNEELVEKLKQELTVRPRVCEDFGEAPEFPIWRENSTRLYVPRAYGIHKFGLPKSEEPQILGEHCDRLHNGFHGTLRNEQISVVNDMKAALEDRKRRGGIMELPCGFGKTTLALHLLAHLGKKALIICHKDFLIHQWKERAHQFLPTVRVGIIKQSKVQVDGYDIVIASLPSLAMRDYDPKVLEGFGVVVVDECHHVAAEVFSRALPKVTSHYMIGLSATLVRKDGLTKVIKWYLGDTAVKVHPKDSATSVRVQMHKYYEHSPNYGQPIYFAKSKLCIPKMMNETVAYGPRNEFLVDKILPTCLDPARKLLILSERRGHLEALETLLTARAPELCGNIGYYVGGMTDTEQKKSTEKKIILATVQMTSEGFDVPSLNTLVLASSPLSGHLEQVVGRILRGRGERQVQPLIIDLIDDFSIFARYGAKRRKFYQTQGYLVEDGSGRPIRTREEIEAEENVCSHQGFMMLEDDGED